MDDKMVRLGLCASIAIFLIPSVIFAASFDCAKATSEVEKLICAESRLSQLDEKLSNAYKDILRHAINPGDFRLEQMKWLREIRDVCTDSSCLEKEYLSRLDALERLMPAELRRLLSTDEALYDFRKADLNGDGLSDYVFIVTSAAEDNKGEDTESDNRTLKIAVRSPNGRLKIVKSNDKIILGKSAGGVFGDPYCGIETGDKEFSVSHAGGSSSRWYNTFTFGYSRRDKTWQLIRAYEISSAPDEEPEQYVFEPLKDFGKIDIEDFDPHRYGDSNK